MMKNLYSTAILAVGIALAGIFVYCGIHEIAVENRQVSVKGLSTQDVKADYVVWPLNFSVEGNDVKILYDDMAATRQIVTDFLISKGFDTLDIRYGNTSVTDNWANFYEHRPDKQYSLSSSIIVSTSKVDRVIANQRCGSELLAQGIILNTYDWDVDYQFNGLNELKPKMIEEATKNARAVAQKFADDSNSSLGGIRHASQGQFTITADAYEPWIKHIRVVTTVDYALTK